MFDATHLNDFTLDVPSSQRRLSFPRDSSRGATLKAVTAANPAIEPAIMMDLVSAFIDFSLFGYARKIGLFGNAFRRVSPELSGKSHGCCEGDSLTCFGGDYGRKPALRAP